MFSINCLSSGSTGWFQGYMVSGGVVSGVKQGAGGKYGEGCSTPDPFLFSILGRRLGALDTSYP